MKIRTVGIDLAKQVFQVHGVDAQGEAVLRKKLERSKGGFKYQAQHWVNEQYRSDIAVV